MLVEGAITSSDCLIKLSEAQGFVKVKYDGKFIQLFSKTSLPTKENVMYQWFKNERKILWNRFYFISSNSRNDHNRSNNC